MRCGIGGAKLVGSIRVLEGELLEIVCLFVQKFPLWPSFSGLGLAFPFARFVGVFLRDEDSFSGSDEEGGVREGKVCYF